MHNTMVHGFRMGVVPWRSPLRVVMVVKTFGDAGCDENPRSLGPSPNRNPQKLVIAADSRLQSLHTREITEETH
jgi:hypothetical protein